MDDQQAVGKRYIAERMLLARNKTWEVIEHVARRITPGMHESEASVLCKQAMVDLGFERVWHPAIARFGGNTLKTFKERSDGDPILRPTDIFFLDLGIVWAGHEGDAGSTFVVGDDEEMKSCAAAAKALFIDVEEYWRATGATGAALYSFAERRAAEMGWRLNLDVKGHRVSDFPHAIYKAGKLGDFGSCPSAGLWILEIQIAHPTQAYGAFYEDLLM